MTIIEKDFSFKAGINVDNKFQINLYNLHLSMNLYTESIREQYVAMSRINYLIENCLEGCVFADETDKSMLDKYLDCNIRLCTIPEHPHDQMIMFAIMLKINSICEGRIEVVKIKINSELSDFIWIVGDSSYIPEMFQTKNWWNESNICISNYCFNKNKKGKIVRITSKAEIEWDDKHSWNQIKDKSSSNEILFNNIDQKP